MSLHDGSAFLTKPASNTLRAPAGEWGRTPLAGEYVDQETQQPVAVEVRPLSAAQAAAMNFPGEEPEKPKRARAATGTTTRTPRKRAAATADGE